MVTLSTLNIIHQGNIDAEKEIATTRSIKKAHKVLRSIWYCTYQNAELGAEATSEGDNKSNDTKWQIVLYKGSNANKFALKKHPTTNSNHFIIR